MRVVPALDELKHRGLRLCFGAKPETLKQLALQRREEALAHRVVIAIPDRAHRRPHPSGFAARSKSHRGVLRPLIGVMNDLLRASHCERHVQGTEHQLAQQMRAHGPAHYLATEHIEHHGQVQEAFPGREWSERPGVVELSPDLSSPNRTCTFQRIRLSI